MIYQAAEPVRRSQFGSFGGWQTRPRSIHISQPVQSQISEMAGDKDTLLSFGFDPARVECASENPLTVLITLLFLSSIRIYNLLTITYRGFESYWESRLAACDGPYYRA